jgi:hypothetical protein
MMPRHATLALCAVIGLPLPVRLLGAQGASASPAASSPAAPALPDTPAGRVLRAWMDAFDSADSARYAAYFQRYDSTDNVASALEFREGTGGFDLLAIERSAPRHLEYTMRQRKRPLVVYGILDLTNSDPVRVSSHQMYVLGLNATVAAARIDAAARARAIDGAVAALDSFYVFPDVAKRLADSLRARQRRGSYDAETNGITFALRLDREISDIAHDKHMRLWFTVDAVPPMPAEPPKPTPEDRARARAEMDDLNCGFVKAEQLQGNVGYLRFDNFFDVDACAQTADAAMTFLAGTKALIIDMRENGGGKPAMVSYIASYLFDARSHLNDIWTRRTGTTEEFWTRDSVPGRKFGGTKPVYVLTSAHTFSGGEEFTYDLQTQKRAIIVGETTGGGAHPVRGRRIDAHFMFRVPFARPVNPVTHTDWEGTGVTPDVHVPAGEALGVAKQLIQQQLQKEHDGRAQP